MKRFLVMLMACGLAVFSLAACGDDDEDIAVTGETPRSETEEDGADDPTTDETTTTDGGDETGTDTDSDVEDVDAEGGDGVPSSEEICAAIEPALETVYGTPTETEEGDGSYPSCDVDFEAARVVVSAFALDDPLVGGDFDDYIEAVSDTVDGLEPVDGIGDAAVANETGQGYIVVGENVVTVSRVFNDQAGDASDLTEVMGAVAEALA